MRRILIYGLSLTNGRKEKVEKSLKKKYKILIGGGKNNIASKILDILKVLFADIVYIAPFYHSKSKVIGVAKKCNKKVVIDYYASFFDMNVLDRKIFSIDSKEAVEAMNADKYAVENGDCLIFLNSGERDYYLKLVDHEDFAEKSAIVPLVIDEYPEAELNYWKKDKKNFEIVFCGTYIPLHGIEVILEASKILKNNRVPIHFTIWGNKDCIEKSKPYQKMACEWDLNDIVSFTNEFQKQEYIYWCQKNCDCMLGAFGKSQKAYSVVPNKVIDALSLGIPCITGVSSGLKDFFDGRTDLITIEHNPVDLVMAISHLMGESQENITKRVNKGKQIYQNYFSIESFGKRINSVFEKL